MANVLLQMLKSLENPISNVHIIKNRTNSNGEIMNYKINNIFDGISEVKDHSEMKIDNAKIARELNLVFEELMNAFHYPLVKMLLEKESYFAGGCIRSLITDQEVNDYDIYFTDKIFADRFLELMNIEFESAKGMIFDHKKLQLIAKTQNALTMSLGSKIVQFITKYTGKPDDLLKNFDFSNSKAYFIPNSPYEEQTLNRPHIHEDMLWTLNHKVKCLKFNPKCWNPLNSMKRLLKFTKQGYNISNAELKKLMEAIKNSSSEQLKDFCNQDY